MQIQLLRCNRKFFRLLYKVRRNQRQTIYTGRVKSVDTVANTITVERGGGLPQANTSVQITIDDVLYTVESSTVTRFVLPQIVTSGSARLSVSNSIQTGAIAVAIVAKNIRGISIPRKVSVKELEVTDKLTTSTNEANTLTDINNTVNTVQTDLQTVQRKLGLIS